MSRTPVGSATHDRWDGYGPMDATAEDQQPGVLVGREGKCGRDRWLSAEPVWQVVVSGAVSVQCAGDGRVRVLVRLFRNHGGTRCSGEPAILD